MRVGIVRQVTYEGWHCSLGYIRGLALFARLYMRVGILLTCGKYLHIRIISEGRRGRDRTVVGFTTTCA